MKILRNYEMDFVCKNCTSADLSASLGVSTEPWTYTYNNENRLIETQNSSLKTQHFSFSIQNSSLKINCEYSPFGKITRTTGDIVNSFAFRFSSEYSDTETGLVYYNYRYYSPELGRWLSRDLLEEYGGVNIYAMTKNNPLYWWDWNGLDVWVVSRWIILPEEESITFPDIYVPDTSVPEPIIIPNPETIPDEFQQGNLRVRRRERKKRKKQLRSLERKK